MKELSKMEQVVLDRICLGESNKEIANHLNLQESTIKVHVRRSLKKLGANNRTKAALIAIGHLPPEVKREIPGN